MIIPRHTLRRATARERDLVDASLTQFTVGGPGIFRQKKVNVTSSGWEWEALPESQWRYLVIEHSGNNWGLHQIMHVSRLCRVELRVSPEFHYERGKWRGMGFDPVRDTDYLSNQRHFQRGDMELRREDILEIRDAYRDLKSAERSHPDIARAVTFLDDASRLETRSRLRVLGLFAAIESVLTHNPKGRYDALKHQIAHKANLISARLASPIVFEDFFGKLGDVTREKMWEKLYEYRSTIAHGGVPDFASSLKLLKDGSAAEKFLRDSAKKILRQALKEPQLFVDLRRC